MAICSPPARATLWQTATAGKACGFAATRKSRYLCAMKVDGKDRRTIWVEPGGQSVGIIDQRTLPHEFVTRDLRTLADAVQAIKTMQVRGAPLIGVTAAYGVWLALRADASDDALTSAYAALFRARPTAINLKCALDDMSAAVRNPPDAQR